MEAPTDKYRLRGLRFASALLFSLVSIVSLVILTRETSLRVNAAPIPPPDGYPKFNMSSKTVTPTLANTSGETLHYTIVIRNTGGYAATNTHFSDPLPQNTTYNGDAQASSGNPPVFVNGAVTWTGEVGFDDSVVISFSADVLSGFSGVIMNSAVISHAMIAMPVIVSAESVITDKPIYAIEKSSAPVLPGPNMPMTYELNVTNLGQPAVAQAITVIDFVPVGTALKDIGPDGYSNPAGDIVTWTRSVNLNFGETSLFTFSVDIQDVPSGTVISNDTYLVTSAATGPVAGDVYTVTAVDPIFYLDKVVFPDPPGSNREVTFTLTLLNKGSLATGLVITDRVPAGVTNISGVPVIGGVATWTLPQLDSGEVAQFSFSGFIPDVADIPIINDDYGVCSAEGVCEKGNPLVTQVEGASFLANVEFDPIAKKPGGGTGPVTPTITIYNQGPGNAIDATALIYFYRVSVQLNDLLAIPNRGVFSTLPDCGLICRGYKWIGDLGVGETITLTTNEGQSTFDNQPGHLYTATVVITDSLSMTITPPISATATGVITDYANLIPSKFAPFVVGPGQVMTYNLNVRNGALGTDSPPQPVLTDVVPLSTTLVDVSPGGVADLVGGRTIIAWTLPDMSPGETIDSWFSVLVDPDLISGTEIINQEYSVSWYENEVGGNLSNSGEPITTVVREVGLIDSFKTVTPTLARPGPGNILTFTVNVVNSGPSYLSGVRVYDLFPWEHSTYRRDAIASAGTVLSDIVSLSWTGNLAPYSSELITFSVLVDSEFEGAITNTARINHSSLAEDLLAQAVAYITDHPVLKISKTAYPVPAIGGGELLYTIRVVNLGQQSTNLVITDKIPPNTQYIDGSASGSGQLYGDEVQWEVPVLASGEQMELTFRVVVLGGFEIINSLYHVSCAEGVSDWGDPVVTPVTYLVYKIFLPHQRR